MDLLLLPSDYKYHLSDSKDPTITETVHRNHLVEYYPEEGSLPAMIEEYVPPDNRKDDFYERFVERRTGDLNNSSTKEEHDSFAFPIEPLRSIPPNTQKRLSAHSYDSGITSPVAFSRTPVLFPATAIENSTPYPSTSQHTQVARPSPKEHLSLSQQDFRDSATRMARNSVKLHSKEPRYNRSQPNHTDFQSVLRARTRQGYKL